MKNKGFAFYQNFWDSVESLPLEQQKDVIYAIVKYGITGEIDTNPLGVAMTQAFKPAIDNSVERFNSNSENGRIGGRPTKIASSEISSYLVEHPRATAKEVAEYFGVTESAIQKREEWKNRKNMEKPAPKVFDF
jgi:hypothetical protein